MFLLLVEEQLIQTLAPIAQNEQATRATSVRGSDSSARILEPVRKVWVWG